MKSQILMAIGVAIVASVLVTGLASSIYAQSNMTGGNMTIIDTISDGGGDSDDDGEDEDNEGENEEGEGNN
jgi:hypothetical protein